MHASAQLALSTLIGQNSTRREWCHPGWVRLLTLINVIKIIPQKQSQKSFSLGDRVNMTKLIITCKDQGRQWLSDLGTVECQSNVHS